MTTIERDALLLQCLPAVERIARRWSRESRTHDAGDLTNEGVCAILVQLQHDTVMQSPCRYLVKTARRAIVHAMLEDSPIRVPWRSQYDHHGHREYRRFVASLDASITDSGLGLADLLEGEACYA